MLRYGLRRLLNAYVSIFGALYLESSSSFSYARLRLRGQR